MSESVHGLERYDHGLQYYLKRNRFCAVYAVGHDVAGYPVKIGMAEDIKNRLGSLQTSNWLQLTLFGHWWTAGAPLARRVEKSCHEFFTKAGRHVQGEWFDIKPDVAVLAIEKMAASMGIELMTQEHMVARTKRNAHVGGVKLHREQEMKHARSYTP